MNGARPAWFAMAIVASAALGSCSETGGASAAQGERLFQSKELSSATTDLFTCATCHDATASDPSIVRPGAPLAGVTRRTSFWGGMEGDLLAAVNDCRRYFMSDRQALAPDDLAAESLYAYLRTLEPGNAAPVPFTIVSMIVDVPHGDTTRGAGTYAQTCGNCHGELHTGASRLSAAIPILPEDVLASHATYDAPTQRLIFIEKVRHGGFYGYTGVMPPFAKEVLPDAALGDVLETLGVTGTTAGESQ